MNDWLDALAANTPAAAAKIDNAVAEHRSDRRSDASPPEFPISSQIAGGLRELRVRFANTRYRVVYQRSDNGIVLLHAIEKSTGSLPPGATRLAQEVRYSCTNLSVLIS